MRDTHRDIVGADGRPLRRRPKSDKCPGCGAGKEKRINTAGFGTYAAVINCGNCGFEFDAAGETE